MTTREYRNYKRMSKMTVRFLEKDHIINDSRSTELTSTPTTTMTTPTTSISRAAMPTIAINSTTSNANISTSTSSKIIISDNQIEKPQFLDTLTIKNEVTPEIKNRTNAASTKTEDTIKVHKTKISNGRYTNWATQHSTLASLPWCCIGDLMAFCDRYEYRTINRNDPTTHNRIVTEVKTLLNGKAPFDIRKRFPSDIHSPENLWVCIGRCAGVEYHLNRILSLFRKPLDKLSADKQRMIRHDFHLAINELRLDISARITEVRLYDCPIFERDFRLQWQDDETAAA